MTLLSPLGQQQRLQYCFSSCQSQAESADGDTHLRMLQPSLKSLRSQSEITTARQSPCPGSIYTMTCNLLHSASQRQRRLGINSRSREDQGQSSLGHGKFQAVGSTWSSSRGGLQADFESPSQDGFPTYSATPHCLKLASFSVSRWGLEGTEQE